MMSFPAQDLSYFVILAVKGEQLFMSGHFNRVGCELECAFEETDESVIAI